MISVLKFLRWFFQKVATALLMIVLALAVYGVWLFMRDNVDFDFQRNEIVRALTGERAKTQEAMRDVDARLEKLSLEIEAKEERIGQVDRVIAKLKSLESTWDRLIGNPEQQAANQKQLEKMRTMRESEQGEMDELQNKFNRTTWERDGLEIALGRLEARLVTIEEQQSEVMHYAMAAWAKTRWWLLGALVLYFLGPTVGKSFLYYGIAPTIIRGRPVRLSDEMKTMPDIAPSRVSSDISLSDGERLWVRERFLQGSDEGLLKKTRFLLDWRMPFTCLASGLVEMVEMRVGENRDLQRVTLSNQANPHIELSVITLSEGGSLVLRPSFLAGAVATEGKRLQVRRRWQIFRWQSWVTLQFRFFEFVGPCKLVVAGSRGVRTEVLFPGTEGKPVGRRTNQIATIGFTPNLDYKPVRAETFWGYYRGMNPLFDDLFSGEGVFLCQEIPMEESGGQIKKFWAGLWSSVLKVFGL